MLLTGDIQESLRDFTGASLCCSREKFDTKCQQPLPKPLTVQYPNGAQVWRASRKIHHAVEPLSRINPKSPYIGKSKSGNRKFDQRTPDEAEPGAAPVLDLRIQLLLVLWPEEDSRVLTSYVTCKTQTGRIRFCSAGRCGSAHT